MKDNSALEKLNIGKSGKDNARIRLTKLIIATRSDKQALLIELDENGIALSPIYGWPGSVEDRT